MSHLQPWWWLHNISWIKAAVIRQSIHWFDFVIPEALEKPQTKTQKRNGFHSHVQKHTRRQSRRTSQFDPLHIFAFHGLSPSAPSAQTRSKPFPEPQIHRWGKIIANPVGNCFNNVSTHHYYTKRIIDRTDVYVEKHARCSTHSTMPLHVTKW